MARDGEQELLLPPMQREWLQDTNLAWFVIDAVAELDLGRVLRLLAMPGEVPRRMFRR